MPNKNNMSLTFGAIGAAMEHPMGQYCKETASYIGKLLNVSTKIEELGVEDLSLYDGKGRIGEEADVFLVPVDNWLTNYWKHYQFSTVVWSSTTLVISGTPKVRENHNVTNIPVELPVLLTIVLAAFVVSVFMLSVSTVHKYAIKSRPVKHASCRKCISQVISDSLLLILPLIQKEIPFISTMNFTSLRILFAFWLSATSIVYWHICSSFKADATTIQYLKVDQLTDILQHRSVTPKILYNSGEHLLIKERARRDPKIKEISKTIDEKLSYFSDVVEMIDLEVYEEISRGNTFLIANGLIYEMASCIPLSEAKIGEITIYFSRKHFFEMDYSFLIDRNLSTSVSEIINIGLMNIFETKTFVYLFHNCKYVVYFKNVWQETVTKDFKLAVKNLSGTFTILFLSSVLGMFISIFCICVNLLRKNTLTR